jgi:alpha-1,2-mannosyltransferase
MSDANQQAPPATAADPSAPGESGNNAPDFTPGFFRNPRVVVPAALGVWVIAIIVIALIVIKQPVKGNLCGLFRDSSLNWWAGRELYESKTIDGFLYFPQFAIIYTPFALAPSLAGDILWRIAGVAMLCAGMYRLAGLVSSRNAPLVFGWGSIAAAAPAMASIRCGQPNLIIAATLLHVAVELARRRWLAATVWLVVALAIKPIIAVTILLVAAVYRPMSWRLALGILVFVVAPFAMQNPHYVLEQYQLCCTKISMSALPNRPFPDFRGLLWTAGWMMPQSLLAGVQVLAALGTLALCLIAARRWDGTNRSLCVMTLSAFYLMLFNPRTESNSYVIMTPIITIPAAAILLDWHRQYAAWILWGIAICLSCDGWEYRLTHPWLKPATCLLCAYLLGRALVRGRTKNYFSLADRQLPS